MRAFVRILVSLAALAASTAVAPTAQAQVAPAITVTPDSGLVDGQTVTVAGTGFGENFTVVSLCAAGVAEASECAFSNMIGFESADTDGNFTLDGEVPVLVLDGGGSTLADCRVPGACEVVAFAFDEMNAILARTPVEFDPSGPLPVAPTLAAAPSTDLVDGQVVTVTGSGYAQGTARIEQCAVVAGGPDCRQVGYIWDETGIGTIAGTVVVRTILKDWDGVALADCRVDPCWLLSSNGRTRSLPVDLHFDPAGELLPPPVLQAEPSTGLVDGQVVELTLTDFSPETYISLEVCGTEPVDSYVLCHYLDDIVSDASGAASTEVALRAIIRGYYDGPAELDCRVTVCTISARDDASGEVGSLAVHFDPAGELLPPPTFRLEPGGEIVEGAAMTFSGTGFTPLKSASVEICVVDTDNCDEVVPDSPLADVDGNIAGELRLYADFMGYDGPASCRLEPGCELVVSDTGTGDRVTVAITFGPLPAGRGRYLDPIFAPQDIEVTHDVVYREAINSKGQVVELKMDIYQPAGDTATVRPAFMWMHGGWFIFGDKADMAPYAMASAQRGYVGISLQYRLRPDASSSQLDEVVEAAYDAYDDSTAAVQWLIDNAATYRIDPRAIIAGGYSAGAVNAFHLAYMPGQFGPPSPLIAGSAPISGIPFLGPEPGDPPMIAFHAVDDGTVPYGPAKGRCEEANLIESLCEWVEYAQGDHYVVISQFRDIVARTHDFMYENVLAPLGYRAVTPQMPPVTRPEITPPSTPSTPSRPSPTTSLPTPTSPTTTMPGSAPAGPSTSLPGTATTVRPNGPTVVGGVPGGQGDAAVPARPVPGRPAYTG